MTSTQEALAHSERGHHLHAGNDRNRGRRRAAAGSARGATIVTLNQATIGAVIGLGLTRHPLRPGCWAPTATSCRPLPDRRLAQGRCDPARGRPELVDGRHGAAADQLRDRHEHRSPMGLGIGERRVGGSPATVRPRRRAGIVGMRRDRVACPQFRGRRGAHRGVRRARPFGRRLR